MPRVALIRGALRGLDVAELRATPCSPAPRQHRERARSGIAIMSDSSIGLKPVIESLEAHPPSTRRRARRVDQKALSCPDVREHSRMKRMSALRPGTSRRLGQWRVGHCGGRLLAIDYARPVRRPAAIRSSVAIVLAGLLAFFLATASGSGAGASPPRRGGLTSSRPAPRLRSTHLAALSMHVPPLALGVRSGCEHVAFEPPVSDLSPG